MVLRKQVQQIAVVIRTQAGNHTEIWSGQGRVLVTALLHFYNPLHLAVQLWILASVTHIPDCGRNY